jgi:hypothetical protein
VIPEPAITSASCIPKAGEVRLKVPKLRRQTFETAIIERYRRRESSVAVETWRCCSRMLSATYRHQQTRGHTQSLIIRVILARSTIVVMRSITVIPMRLIIVIATRPTMMGPTTMIPMRPAAIYIYILSFYVFVPVLIVIVGVLVIIIIFLIIISRLVISNPLVLSVAFRF